MNELTKFLIQELLDEQKTVAIYGGGFKPPTKGHFTVVEKALSDFPEIDEFKVFVGSGVRDGVTQEESIKVWDIYKNYLSPKVNIEPSIAPVKSILGYAKENPETKVYWVLGAREGNEEDVKDIINRTKTIDKYPNIEVKTITTTGGVSGTKTRDTIKSGNKELFYNSVPDIKEKDQIWNLVSSVIKEVGDASLTPYKWKEVDREGYWYYVQFTTDNDVEYKVDLESIIHVDRNANELEAFNVEFIAKPKGAEGYSDKIVVNKGEIYRVMSTIVDIIKYYVKKYKAQAILYSPAKKGNEDFGSQRDQLYKTFIKKALPNVYFEQKGDWIAAILPKKLNEADPKVGTGKKPKGSGRRLYTDEDPKDTVSIKFKTKEDIVDTLNKKSFKAKAHVRQSQVINLIHQRVRAAYGRAKDPEVKSRLKRALDYIEKRKEMSKKKTERLRKLKEAITEAKQVGVIYHYTTFENGLKILQSNELKGSEASDSTHANLVYAVSFTRDKRFHDNHINEATTGYDFVIKEVEDNYYIVRAMYKEKSIGELYFIKRRSKPILMAGSLSVDPNHRRKGIASGMYEFAEKELGMKFVRSDDVLTPDGKLLWNNPNRKFGLSERFLNEAKQVGTIYHYTTFENGLKILQSNELKSADTADSTNANPVYAVSFTRDKRFHDNHNVGFDVSSFGQRPQVRFTVDGDKLSNKFKVQPYSQGGAFSKDRKGFEAEERVISNKPFSIPILSYIKSVDILIEYKKPGKDDWDMEYDYKTYAPLSADLIEFAQSKNLPINLIVNKNGDPWPDKAEKTIIQKILNWVGIKENLDPKTFTDKKSSIPYGSGFALVKEIMTDTEVICDNCGWEWNIKDGGEDLYVCHKCGHDNEPKDNSNKAWNLQEGMLSLSKYMIDNGMNIKPLPKIKVIKSDKQNASDLLGKTAFYNPNDKSITLYTMDRHPKDILRSFAHEMIHHEQNLNGKLENITTTNTNEGGDLPEIEREAYEKGNMMLRNWEDSIKSKKYLKEYKYKQKVLTELFEKALPIIDKVSKNLYIVSNGDDIEAKYNIKLEFPERDLWSMNWFFTPDNKNKSPEAWKQVTATSFKVLEDWLKTNNPKAIYISGNTGAKTKLYKAYIDKLQTLLNNRYKIDNTDEDRVVLRSIEKISQSGIKKRMETLNESYEQALNYFQNGDINSKSKIERWDSIKKKIKREVLYEIYNLNPVFIDIPKFNQPKTFIDKLNKSLNEITLSKDNAVKTNGDLTGGEFTVGNKTYKYSIKNIPNPYKDLGLFYNIQFTPQESIISSPTKDTDPKDYIKILSTMYKIIVDFVEKEKPDYIGIASLDNIGDKNYHRIYANLTDNKYNRIPGYFRKDASLEFDSPAGNGRFVVLKRKNV